MQGVKSLAFGIWSVPVARDCLMYPSLSVDHMCVNSEECLLVASMAWTAPTTGTWHVSTCRILLLSAFNMTNKKQHQLQVIMHWLQMNGKIKEEGRPSVKCKYAISRNYSSRSFFFCFFCSRMGAFTLHSKTGKPMPSVSNGYVFWIFFFSLPRGNADISHHQLARTLILRNQEQEEGRRQKDS